MKHGILLVLMSALASCQSRYDGFGYEKELHPGDIRNWHSDLIDHDKPGWDRLGVWRRLEGSPPRFVPKDLPVEAPVDDRHGTWVVDAVDRSLFYVPKGGTPKYSEGVLKAEASKVTNKISKARNGFVNALGIILFWPIATSLSLFQQGAQNLR